jgi:radical SAM-linked protein
MDLDAPQTATPPTAEQVTPPPRFKVRFRFRKSGDLRFLSHHDLLRCFERLLRRAALPVRSTAGFNPRPRLVFALSLPLGVVGCEEIADLELTEDLPALEVLARLRRHAPPGLEFLSASAVAPNAKIQVRSLCYRLPLAADQLDRARARVSALMEQEEVWVRREKPTPGRVNLRPTLRELRVTSDALEMHLWLLPQGTARPAELLELLELTDVLDAGGVLERTGLELEI